MFQGGINEWLLLPFGAGDSSPCEKQTDSGSISYTIDIPGSQPQEIVNTSCTSVILILEFYENKS